MSSAPSNPVMIAFDSTESVAVDFSLEDCNMLQESIYLLKSPANAVRLAHSIDEIEVMIYKTGRPAGRPYKFPCIIPPIKT